jgi:hypothetical protein
MVYKRLTLLASIGFTTLLCSTFPALAQSVGAAASFAVVGSAGVTAAGGAGTIVTGDVGSSPSASITGFPPAAVAPPFGLHPNDTAAIAAQAAGVALFTSLSTGACTDTPAAQMNGANFGPGIHCFTSTADLAATGNLTLTGAGVYIFRVPSSLTANVLSTVTLVGVDPCTVFWQVGSAATLNGVNFPGNVVAQAGVTLGVGSSLTGRALATVGPVTLSGSNSVGGCSSAGGGTVAPTLTKFFGPAAIQPGGVSTLTITLVNSNATAATLTAALVDTLPSGVAVALAPNAGTTCTGGVVTATPGGSTITLSAGSAIPASSSCTVTANVTGTDATAAGCGSFVNVLPANALQTGNGNNASPAAATLTVSCGLRQVPTLSEWSMILLTLLIGGAGFAAMRRRG